MRSILVVTCNSGRGSARRPLAFSLIGRRFPLNNLWPLALALLVTGAMRTWLVEVGPLPLDRWSLRFTPYPPRPEPWRDVASFFSLAGTPLFALVTVSIAAWLVRRACGWRSAAFVVFCCVGVVTSDVLKAIFGPTPLWVEARGDVAPSNFPSGHVVYAVGLAGSLAVLARERGRRDLVVLASAFIVLMGIFRVAEGAHLPSDVVAGYVLGAGWLGLALRIRGAPDREPVGEPAMRQ